MTRPTRTRRPRARAASLLAALVPSAMAGACGGDAPPEPPALPNVILLSIDTLRRDHVGLYGYERDTTPVIDALAEESLVFDRAYTTMSFTLIAHMSLLTGLYPTQHGVYNERLALPETVPTLAQRLRQRDYHSIGFYRPGWLDGRYGFDRGFDGYEPHYLAPEADEHMRRALAERPEDRPLFLFVHLFDVHSGNLVREDATMYEPPAPFDRHFLEDAPERMLATDIERLWEDSSGATPELHEAVVALYDGGIRYVDDLLGRWLELWREEGILENSILVVTSDHGEGLNQRGQKYGGHGDAWEEGLQIPLLLRFSDGRHAGERRPEPVSLVDLVPTLLDALDLPPDPRLPGASLLRPPPDDRLIFAQRPNRVEVVYQWPWKLVRGTILYDLEADPEERRPIRKRWPWRDHFVEVAGSIQARAEEERARWFQPGEAADAAPIPADIEADLRALGYAE